MSGRDVRPRRLVAQPPRAAAPASAAATHSAHSARDSTGAPAAVDHTPAV